MIRPEQYDLFRAVETTVTDADVRTLLDALDGAGWLTASTLKARLHWPDRKARAAANASLGQVISGQRGYKLACQATPEEVRHAAAWLRHQAAEMTQRATLIESALC